MSGRLVFTWGEGSKKSDSHDSLQTQTQQNAVEDVVLIEYIKAVENEYNAERNKKYSFETRAGILIAFLGAIIVFLIEKVPFSDISFCFTQGDCNCVANIKSLFGLLVYIFLVLTVKKLIEVINVKQHKNFDVRGIDEELLTQSKIESLCRLIFTYRDCIINFRELNEKRAIALKQVLYFIFSMLAFLVIFVNINL